MPKQILVNQKFPGDDQDIPIDDLDCTFFNTPSLGLPCPTSDLGAGFWHNPQAFYSSTQNYDRGTSVVHPSFAGIEATSSSIGESTPYNGYQLQNFASPPLGTPLTTPSHSVAESSQVMFAPHWQSISQPISIPLQSDFIRPALLLHCRWICDNTPCMFAGTIEELRVHCSASHFGPKDALIACQWEGCAYYKRSDRAVRVMRQDSIWRHTRETHLFLKRGL